MKRQIVINNPFNDASIRFRVFRQKLRYRIISLFLIDYEKEKIATVVSDTKDYYYKMCVISKDESDRELYKEEWVRLANFKAWLNDLNVKTEDNW